MTTITVRELKARASEILRNLQASGEEVVVTRRGKPCAKLVPFKESGERRSLRSLRGALSFLPELEDEDFEDIKKIWEPRPQSGQNE